MRAPIAVLLLLLACKRDDRSSECDMIRKDPATAPAKLTQLHPKDPVKVAEIIERCIAPSGAPCERLAKVVAALPDLMPASTGALTPPTNVAELCAGMPPEMQRCMMPSYALAHPDECAKIRADLAASLARAAGAGFDGSAGTAGTAGSAGAGSAESAGSGGSGRPP